MTPTAYYQQYAPAPQMQYNQITRRPLTENERQLPGNFYRSIQRALRGVSMLCLILFVLSYYVIPVVITDAVALDALSIVLMVFMVVMGGMAIGMSVNVIIVRKKVGEAMREGTVVEVVAPAYRSGAMQKGVSWTIGPVSVLPTRGIDGLIQEGALTSVLCVPKLKAAIAINNCGLKSGARIMFPPNLEAMAIPVGMAPMAPMAPAAPMAPVAPVEAPLPPPPPPESPVPPAETPPAPPVEEPAEPTHHESKKGSKGHKKKSSARSK